MKELQPRGPFLERKTGTDQCYDAHYELAPDLVGELNNHAGKFVEAWVRQEHWIYQGPDNEDHSVTKSHIYGTLLEAKPDSLAVEITAGEKKYDVDAWGTSAIPAGKENYPYRRKEFCLRHSTDILEIERLDIEGQTFQWGKTSSAEQKELSA